MIKDYDFFADQIEIIETDSGYMVLDNDCQEYLYDDIGENCFTSYTYACKLAHELIEARLEHI
jgi:hypothetical protein